MQVIKSKVDQKKIIKIYYNFIKRSTKNGKIYQGHNSMFKDIGLKISNKKNRPKNQVIKN